MRLRRMISLLVLGAIVFLSVGCRKTPSTDSSMQYPGNCSYKENRKNDLWYKAKIEKALAEGADLNAPLDSSSNGKTFLHDAALGDKIESARLLLDNGVTVDLVDRTKSTPLHRAAQKGSLRVAKLLIENGADIDAKDHICKTPLSRSVAAEINRVAILHLLIDAGAEVDTIDMYGHTPLIWASFYGNVEAIDLLLAKGLDINAQGKDGMTGLHHAARHGHYKAVRTLLENGADVTIRAATGRTPLGDALVTMESKDASQSGKRKAAKLIRAKGGIE